MIDLYYMGLSAPCRAVRMTMKALDVDVNIKTTNVMTGETRTPEYKAINTEQVIPTIVDDGFHLWESRAIMIYLVEAYGKDDSLYSKIPKEQAVINQRLYFDMGTLYQNLSEYYYPQLFDNLPADPEKLKKADRAVDLLNTFLEANEYVAGDRLTIADFSIIASLSTFTCIGYDYNKFPNVARWYDKLISTIPGHEINEEGLQNLKEYIPESFACCETN